MVAYPAADRTYTPSAPTPRSPLPVRLEGEGLLSIFRRMLRRVAGFRYAVAFIAVARLVASLSRVANCSEACAAQGVSYFLLTGELTWNGITLEVRYEE